MIIKIININKIESSNGTICNSDMLIEDGMITKVSPNINDYSDRTIDANQNILTPGFVDSHTHPIFINNRAVEFQRRCNRPGACPYGTQCPSEFAGRPAAQLSRLPSQWHRHPQLHSKHR